MDNTTGLTLALIGVAAIGTTLIIVATKDRGATIPSPLPSAVPQYTPVLEQEGPSLPSGAADNLDQSRMDYLSAVDRNATQIFWDRTKQYNQLIYAASKHFNIPSNYIRAIMYTESSGVNWKDLDFSIGLMQVSLGAAKDAISYTGDKAGLLDPQTNIMAGAGYLRWQLNRFNNDYDMATASYNFGSVHRWAPGVAPIAGVDSDAAWDAIVQLVSEGKIKRYTSYHFNREQLVNQGYVNKVNKWFDIFNNVVIQI